MKFFWTWENEILNCWTFKLSKLMDLRTLIRFIWIFELFWVFEQVFRQVWFLGFIKKQLLCCRNFYKMFTKWFLRNWFEKLNCMVVLNCFEARLVSSHIRHTRVTGLYISYYGAGVPLHTSVWWLGILSFITNYPGSPGSSGFRVTLRCDDWVWPRVLRALLDGVV